MTFSNVSTTYFPEFVQGFYRAVYNALPNGERQVLHAAFKIINTSTHDLDDVKALIIRMFHAYKWDGNNHLQSKANVIDFARKITNQQYRQNFPHQTDYYHCHVYYRNTDYDLLYAGSIRKYLINQGIQVHEMNTTLVGPHPLPMFEAHLNTPSQYFWVTDYLEQQQASHRLWSALIHPNKGFTHNQQHYDEARWIGQQLTLRTTW